MNSTGACLLKRQSYAEAVESHNLATMAFWQKEIRQRTHSSISKIFPAWREPVPLFEK